MGQNYKEQLDSLWQTVLDIPGKKILTLVLADGRNIVYDIAADGMVGYQPGIDILLKAQLMRGLLEGGGLIVRQFLDEKIEVDGRLIPRKNIYGFHLGEETWIAMPAGDIAQDPEPGVTYCGG